METWLIWIIVGVVMVAIEVATQQVWTLCLAAGCLVALVGSLCGLDVAWQVILMAFGAVVGYFAFMPLLKKWRHQLDKGHEARTGMDALLGRKGRVTQDIKPGGLGRVQIDGDNWQARSPKYPMAIPAGAEVSVTGYDSIILDVELPQQ